MRERIFLIKLLSLQEKALGYLPFAEIFHPNSKALFEISVWGGFIALNSCWQEELPHIDKRVKEMCVKGKEKKKL